MPTYYKLVYEMNEKPTVEYLDANVYWWVYHGSNLQENPDLREYLETRKASLVSLEELTYESISKSLSHSHDYDTNEWDLFLGLRDVPKDLRGWASYHAWERGHSGGLCEVFQQYAELSEFLTLAHKTYSNR